MSEEEKLAEVQAFVGEDFSRKRCIRALKEADGDVEVMGSRVAYQIDV